MEINKFTTGIHLTNYTTSLPNGSIVGFDADLGEVFALDNKVVTAPEIKKWEGLPHLELDKLIIGQFYSWLLDDSANSSYNKDDLKKFFIDEMTSLINKAAEAKTAPIYFKSKG